LASLFEFDLRLYPHNVFLGSLIAPIMCNDSCARQLTAPLRWPTIVLALATYAESGVMSAVSGRVIILVTLGAVIIAVVATRVALDGGFDTIEVSTSRELHEVLAEPRERVSIVLAPGEYHLTPTSAVDSTCGNCEDPSKMVPMTVGLLVSGKEIWILGPDSGEAIIYTHAGYGVFFKDCDECGIAGITITGGERDTATDATDAAIVAKNSSVSVFHNKIADNIGDSTLVVTNVVGIMGICGRENSFLWVRDNDIIRNSWDGIALYREAEAEIELNLIDGVDKAGGGDAGGGRGVAIGITWNAKAKVQSNVVKRYWKGIGVFVDAHAVVQENIIEEMLTWGIAYWDAGKGKPWVFIENNVVYDCGACGVSITREAPFAGDELPGGMTGNIIVKTGQNPKYDDADYYCFQSALALHAVPEHFAIAGNLFYNNRRASDDLFDQDVTEEDFLKAKDDLLEDILASKQGWFWENSRFLREYAADLSD